MTVSPMAARHRKSLKTNQITWRQRSKLRLLRPHHLDVAMRQENAFLHFVEILVVLLNLKYIFGELQAVIESMRAKRFKVTKSMRAGDDGHREYKVRKLGITGVNDTLVSNEYDNSQPVLDQVRYVRVSSDHAAASQKVVESVRHPELKLKTPA